MRTAREIWRDAWNLLWTGDVYGKFLFGTFCLIFVGWLAKIVAVILSLVGYFILKGMFDPQVLAAVKEMPWQTFLKDYDPAALKEIVQTLCHYPRLVIMGLVLTIPPLVVIFYFEGFKGWGMQAMGIAGARRGLSVSHALCGWGHGWKMVALILWQQTLVGLKMLLLVVPGVRALFSYALAPYLLIDHPDWTSRQCLNESERLMNGHRWRLFKVSLVFVGFFLFAFLLNLAADKLQQVLLEYLAKILGVLVVPYVGMVFALFYENRLDEVEAEKRADENVEKAELIDEQETDEQERNPEDDEH